MRTNTLVALLLCASCQSPTQTFLVSQIVIPEDNDSFGRDIDLDGSIDNKMNLWSRLWANFGVSTQENIDALTQSGAFNIGLDLSGFESRAELRAYQAYSNPGEAFLFDGRDSLRESGGVFLFDDTSINSVEGGAPRLSASGQRFVWGMSLFDELFLLSLEGVEVTGALEGDKLVDGALSGFIRAEEVARMIPALPPVLDALALREARSFNPNGTPIHCEGDADGLSASCEAIAASSFCTDRAADGAMTGVCVSINSQTRTFTEALDGDGDGHYNVIRDPETGGFIENDLRLIFDLAGFGETPEGIVGGLFTLDLNRDGNPDAMGLGVGFEAVPAIKAP